LNKELQLLVTLHDIDLMIKELSDADTAKKVKKMGFKVSRLEELQNSREEIRAQISQRLLRLYDRLEARYGRAIVPINGSTCYGCYIKMPTSLASLVAENKEIRTCENCGRILYWVD
jgi:predicted  nucleic acid-binding Zn-ribbon protein